MNYNFDKIIDRRSTNSMKWDVGENELPLWVADMDFQTAPEIIQALKERLDNGIFGYSIVTKEWEESYINWWEKRHKIHINNEELIFCTGIVPAISSSVRKLTTPGENVLIQTPVYNIFFNSIINNGRNVIESPLDFDGEKYNINFERLENDLSNPQTTLMILCNPQNPGGRIWTKEELAKIGDLCKKHNVIVISDEIHCDITKPGTEYTAFASASQTCKEISISCFAPTKCFNIAGLNTAAVYISNKNLRHKVWRALNTDEVAEPNAFAIQACVAAFSKGENWLNEMNSYCFKNREFAEDFIKNNIPELKCISSDATYLLWVECKKSAINGDELSEFIRRKTGLFVNSGCEYGKAGNNFIRINLACPRSILEDAMNRLKKAMSLL